MKLFLSPGRKTRKIDLRVSDELRDRVTKRAAELQVSEAEFVRAVLDAYFREEAR